MCSLHRNKYTHFNWLRPLWEGHQEIVKRSGRDGLMWVIIHKCMETTQGISLYSYLYLKLEKNTVFLIIFYVFSSTKSENKRAEQVLPIGGVCVLGGGCGSSPNKVHTCK
jgi:hypothetical protein